uniref:C-type natriuretic peptide 1 n=1 Tax=Polypterus endlicherii TaxID=348150 RepID=Q1XGY9_9ACTI|nr:C-type natriuretic peptide 1 [Polypterus endlicherii]
MMGSCSAPLLTGHRILCLFLLMASSLSPIHSRAFRSPPLQFLSTLLEKEYGNLQSGPVNIHNVSSEQYEDPQPWADVSSVSKEQIWGDEPPANENALYLLLRRAAANRTWISADRVKKAWSKGCFGLKLDRIGSISGLGC